MTNKHEKRYYHISDNTHNTQHTQSHNIENIQKEYYIHHTT